MKIFLLIIIATTVADSEIGCSTVDQDLVRPAGDAGLASEQRSAVERFHERLAERAARQEAAAAQGLEFESAGLHLLQSPPPHSNATEYRRSLSSSSPDVGIVDFGYAKDYYQADTVVDDLNGVERSVRPSVAVSPSMCGSQQALSISRSSLPTG